MSVINGAERNSQGSMSKALQHLKRELSSNLSNKKGRSNRSMPRSVHDSGSGDHDAFRVLRSLEGISNSTKNADGRRPIKKIQTRNKAQKNYKSSGSIKTSREPKVDDKNYFRQPSNVLNTERDREITQSMFAQ